MLQRSSLPSTSTAEIADTLQRSLGSSSLARPGWDDARWQRAQDLLPLPATWQQYLLACVGLAVVLGGMLLHVLLSVQIAGADFQLRQLRAEHARIERQNSELVYQIAQRSSLAQMAALAAQRGYVPATGRTYVVRGGEFTDRTGEVVHLPVAVASGRPSRTVDEQAPPPVAWLQQAAQWSDDLRQWAGATASQFWRDITGRVE